MERFKNFIAKKKLLFVVFITGAAVLVVEISATRILAAYFGNTLYSFSSIISTVLGALSLGYYYGGRIADKNPSRRMFYLIILYAGIAVLVLHLLSLFVLPILGLTLSPIVGPLVSSIILFFVPSFLLGTLSPFAIKLQAEHSPEEGIGKISGEVFFWSTLGSIAGSIVSGFFLIPSFGVNMIMLGLSAVLILLGIAGVGKEGISRNAFENIAFFVIAATIATSVWSYYEHQRFLVVSDGRYEKLYIYDGVYRGEKTRFFFQDITSSGAMRLSDGALAYDYTKYYDLYRVFNPKIKNALVIGGGIYSVPKQLLADIPNVHVDVAEIEPGLYDLAKEYFGLSDDPRLENHIADGRRFLASSPARYDLIFVDAYKSLYSMPVHFTTKEFFETAKAKLAPEGIFMANVIGSLSSGTPSFTLSEMRTFKSVFPKSFIFAIRSPTIDAPQNFIFVGWDSDHTVDIRSAIFANDKNPIIRDLYQKLVDTDTMDLSKYKLFTDNYAPVEYYTARLLAQIKQVKD